MTRKHLTEAIARALREELSQYDNEMALASPANPDYFGYSDIERMIARVHELHYFGDSDIERVIARVHELLDGSS